MSSRLRPYVLGAVLTLAALSACSRHREQVTPVALWPAESADPVAVSGSSGARLRQAGLGISFDGPGSDAKPEPQLVAHQRRATGMTAWGYHGAMGVLMVSVTKVETNAPAAAYRAYATGGIKAIESLALPTGPQYRTDRKELHADAAPFSSYLQAHTAEGLHTVFRTMAISRPPLLYLVGIRAEGPKLDEVRALANSLRAD